MTTSREPVEVIPGADPLAPSPPRATKRLRAAMAIGNFGLWMAFFSPVIVAYPVKVGQLAPHDKEVTLAMVLGVSTVMGILANPIIGRLSDRSLSRFGRRRPYILGSMIIGAVGIVTVGLTTSLPLLVVGAVLGAIGFAGGLSVLLSLIPEHIPPAQQGGLAGLIGVSQAIAATVGIVLSGILVKNLPLAFIVPVVVGLVGVLVLCVTLREPAITAAERPPLDVRSFWGSFWVSPRKHPDFGWAWISRFAIFMAFASVVNYQVYYLTSQLGESTESAAQLVGVGSAIESLMLIIASIVIGRLSDRIRRRKPFVYLASAIGAVGLVFLAVNGAVSGFLIALALIGLAQGTYYSVDLALVAEILPDKATDAGKNFGVFAIASNLPQTLAPVIAPLFLAIGVGTAAGGTSNYTALFIASGVFAAIAAVTAIPIRGAR